MKKIIACVCAAALALSLSTAAFAATDLATGATVFVDSINDAYADANYGALLPDCINDNDDTTRWQGDKKMLGENATEDEIANVDMSTLPYFGFAWDEAVTIDSMLIKWEASDPAEGQIAIYYAAGDVSLKEETEPDGTQAAGEKWFMDNGTVWTKLDASAYTAVRGDGIENGYASTDTITFKTPLNTKAIKVVAIKAQDKNDTLSVHEVDVTGEYASGEQPPQTGVESLAVYVVVMVAAAAVIAGLVTVKKVRE